MKYDPTRRSLYFPESGDPIADFSAGWKLDPICAELSRLAYYRFDEGDAPRLEAALARAGFATPVPFIDARQDAQAFGTVAPDGAAFVVFRGTQAGKPQDLLKDFGIGLGQWDGEGEVHKGFRTSFESLRGQIDSWLAGLGGARLIVTGHSLGGAMATVMAALRGDAELVTFGSPRVGDRAFAEQFAGRAVRRYVDCTDQVARVPPELIRYVHVQGMRYIDHLGVVHERPPQDDEIDRDRRAGHLVYLREYAWQVWRNVLVRSLADHAPINYVSAVLGRREGP